MDTGFGPALKDWRNRRRMSQLNLSGVANVSARHIAFLETGRARPSRMMVLQLSEALEVPRIERNALLKAAGFASAYRAREFEDAEMSGIRAAVDWTLSRHAPYPALALDRHWRIVSLNGPGAALVGFVGLKQGDSLIDAFLTEGPLWQSIENKTETAMHLAARLRTESAHLGGDAILDAAAAKIALRVMPGAWSGGAELPPVVPTRIVAGGMHLSLFSTIAQFGTAEDVALADLRIELFFPANEATRQTFEAMAR